MGEDLVGDEQDAYPACQHGREAVEVLIDHRQPDGHDGRSQGRRPGQGELPQLDGSLLDLLVHVARGPKRGQRDEQVADHPAGVEHAADRIVRPVRGQVSESAVGKREGCEAAEQQRQTHHLRAPGPPQGKNQHGRRDDVAQRVGQADQLCSRRGRRGLVDLGETESPGEKEQGQRDDRPGQDSLATCGEAAGG